MPRSRSRLPLLIITILGLALVTVLLLGVRAILRETARQRPAPVARELPDTSRRTIERVERMVGAEGILAAHIERYRVRLDRWPSSLDDLCREPPDLAAGETWDGPYVHANGLLIDPWGQQYRYRAPGLYNEGGYDLWSLGPDGVPDTGDEIGNWLLRPPEVPPDAAAGLTG